MADYVYGVKDQNIRGSALIDNGESGTVYQGCALQMESGGTVKIYAGGEYCGTAHILGDAATSLKNERVGIDHWGCRIVIDSEDDTLVLGFYFDFHKEKIENPKYRHMVEKKLGEKFGTPSKISCILKPKAKQRAMEGHLVRAALEMGGRVTSVEEK